MCGIVGYVGEREVTEVLIKGLKHLEYRGYDSAGVAYVENDGIKILKSEGKIANVQKLIEGSPSNGNGKGHHCGIGHTRWATHGKPTTQNAHPHRVGDVVLVHNGIIENFEEIRDGLVAHGKHPVSETDSELFGFLVMEEIEAGKTFIPAVQAAFAKLEGACSVVVMSEKEPNLIIGLRNGSPLVVARDPEGGVFFASDAQPLLGYTKEVFFLENGDMAIASLETLELRDYRTGEKVSRKESVIDWSAADLDKQGYPHYMLKEIFEQPRAIVDTLNGVLDRAHADPFPMAQQPGAEILDHAKRITIVACGTSWHAALVGKYWLERWAQIPVDVELASEFKYRDPVVDRDTVVVGMSQSGETADTLSAIREMRSRGIRTIGVTNVRGSTISREADAVFYTSAGPEIGVAATKTFTAQMLMMLMWAGYLGLTRGKDTANKIVQLFHETVKLPHLLSIALQPDHEFVKGIRAVASRLQHAKGFFFIGRGYNFPIALEAALKLKEIAYVHAEGYAAGELKHGPIAMIDQNMVVVVLAPNDKWHEKSISNLQEVKARGATVVGIGNGDNESFKRMCDEFIALPGNPGKDYPSSLYAFLLNPVIQLLSYELAVLKGTDVDQPRNLAKSVTVE